MTKHQMTASEIGLYEYSGNYWEMLNQCSRLIIENSGMDSSVTFTDSADRKMAIDCLKAIGCEALRSVSEIKDEITQISKSEDSLENKEKLKKLYKELALTMYMWMASKWFSGGIQNAILEKYDWLIRGIPELNPRYLASLPAEGIHDTKDGLDDDFKGYAKAARSWRDYKCLGSGFYPFLPRVRKPVFNPVFVGGGVGGLLSIPFWLPIVIVIAVMMVHLSWVALVVTAVIAVASVLIGALVAQYRAKSMALSEMRDQYRSISEENKGKTPVTILDELNEAFYDASFYKQHPEMYPEKQVSVDASPMARLHEQGIPVAGRVNRDSDVSQEEVAHPNGVAVGPDQDSDGVSSVPAPGAYQVSL